MPSTSVPVPVDNRPPAASTEKPKRALEIRGKLRRALDVMVWDGIEWNEAARQFNFDVRAMRNALARPHVQAYLRSERQVLRESLSPRNIHRLREIRDKADNMPAIQAIRALEQMGDDQPHAADAASASPGITIRILNVVQSGQSDVGQRVLTDIEARKAAPRLAE